MTANAAEGNFMSGVIEGFYGKPWSQAERAELFQWMSAWGLNTYLYAPKDDLKHRALWREGYSADEAARLGELTGLAKARGIRFIYALAPGLDIRYSDPAELETIQSRIEQLMGLGCRDFALLFDDIPSTMDHTDRARFSSFASAQAQVTNAVFRWVRERAPRGRFLFCPTEYCRRMVMRQIGGNEYLGTIGRELLPEIDVFWTGPEIVSRSISENDIPEDLLRRKPVIWDNLHANDYDRSRFYAGPYAGRAPSIRSKVSGILTNPNNEFSLNYIAIRTLALFLQAPGEWNARAAYLQALGEWEPTFQTVRQPITLQDLRLFLDCYYLPHEDGLDAQQFYDRTRGALKTGPSGPKDELEFVREGMTRLREFCQRATELRDRELFYALSQRIWDLREELDLVERYLENASNRESASFRSDYHLPGTYRGGFVRRLRKLLQQEKDGTFTFAEPQT